MGTTTFVWDPVFDCVTHELDENNNVKAEYHNEPQQYGGVISQRRGTTTSTYHSDALGSTRFLTDSSGNVTDTYLHDAWGNLIASTGTTINPFKWVGKYGYYTDDITKQVYVRARMFMPTVAQWRSIDPLRFIDGVNPFRYARNRSIRFIDPSGLKVLIFGWEGAGAAGGDPLQQGYDVLNDVYKPIAKEVLGDEADIDINYQKILVPLSAEGAAKLIVAKAKKSEPQSDCTECYPRLVLIGYSWGGQYAARVAGFIKAKEPELKIDYVLTIDPVFGFLENLGSGLKYGVSENIKEVPLYANTIAPDQACAWKNYYQDFSEFPAFLGDTLEWAENSLVDKAGFDGPYSRYAGVKPHDKTLIEAGPDRWKRAHVLIPYLTAVQDEWKRALNDIKISPSRKHYTNCDGCKKLDE